MQSHPIPPAPAASHAPIKVMVVDDSAIIRGLMTQVIKKDPALEVSASAADGAMAVSVLKQVPVDVILLDIEMPVMDGLAALPKLLEVKPDAKIIMVSTLTMANAEISMKALALGAVDYLPKPTSRSAEDVVEQFYRELIAKIKALGGKSSAPLPKGPSQYNIAPKPQATQPVAVQQAPVIAKAANPFTPPVAANTGNLPVKYPPYPVKAVAIACSTGGPQALLKVYAGLKGRLKNVPVFITQHMPPTFTTLLCDHLSKVSEMSCTEGKEGETVMAGRTYMAPGDFHMEIENTLPMPTVHINKNPAENFCRPSADPMLRSLTRTYGRHLLVVVLTGMGQDGLEGAKIALNEGATVIAQDEATSVVWGMPRAVAEAGICSAILPLTDVPAYVIKAVEGKA